MSKRQDAVFEELGARRHPRPRHPRDRAGDGRTPGEVGRNEGSVRLR